MTDVGDVVGAGAAGIGGAVDVAPEKALSEAEREALRSRACAMAGLLAQEMCRWLDLVGEVDRSHAWSGYGIKSCAHWLSWACSLAPGTAREHVRVARTLPQVPLLRAAFAAGEVSFSKVREATRLAGRMQEDVLVELAKTCTAAQLERAVRGFRRADPDRLKQERGRSVRWRTDEDGSVVLTARLPAEEGAVVVAALESAVAAIAAEQAADRQAERTERAEQRAIERGDTDTDGAGKSARADDGGECTSEPPVDDVDALIRVANGFLAAGPQDRSGQDRHLVLVHVDAQVLAEGAGVEPASAGDVPAGTSTQTDSEAEAGSVSPEGVPVAGACEVEGVGGISASTAARVACDAMVMAVVRDGNGGVRDFGRRRRLVGAAQRRALKFRDRCCRYPGCTRTRGLQAHHIQHWAAGGRTDLENLVLLCRFHHLAVHEDIAIITPDLHFTTPGGTPIEPPPADDRRSRDDIEERQVLRKLDEVQARTWDWKDEQAAAIRPLWGGEKFDLGYIVATMFTRLIEPDPNTENSEDGENDEKCAAATAVA